MDECAFVGKKYQDPKLKLSEEISSNWKTSTGLSFSSLQKDKVQLTTAYPPIGQSNDTLISKCILQ
jgi:hypothetical protein